MTWFISCLMEVTCTICLSRWPSSPVKDRRERQTLFLRSSLLVGLLLARLGNESTSCSFGILRRSNEIHLWAITRIDSKTRRRTSNPSKDILWRVTSRILSSRQAGAYQYSLVGQPKWSCVMAIIAGFPIQIQFCFGFITISAFSLLCSWLLPEFEQWKTKRFLKYLETCNSRAWQKLWNDSGRTLQEMYPDVYDGCPLTNTNRLIR